MGGGGTEHAPSRSTHDHRQRKSAELGPDLRLQLPLLTVAHPLSIESPCCPYAARATPSAAPWRNRLLLGSAALADQTSGTELFRAPRNPIHPGYIRPGAPLPAGVINGLKVRAASEVTAHPAKRTMATTSDPDTSQ